MDGFIFLAGRTFEAAGAELLVAASSLQSSSPQEIDGAIWKIESLCSFWRARRCSGRFMSPTK
jgi:hypothetical protein